MRRIKKLTLIFTSLVLLIASLCQPVCAIELSPRASLYLNGYGASLYEGTSKGSVSVEFTVSATGVADLVGVGIIYVYKEDGTLVSTITGTVSNGLLRENSKGQMSGYTYYGEPNTVYYMVLSMYAKIGDGSDYRLYTTNKCRSHI